MFRNLGIFALCVAPCVAFGWESTVETVNFETDVRLYDGLELDSGLLPDAHGSVGVQFTVNSSANLTLDMLAESELHWPDALTQSWSGIQDGGTAELLTTSQVVAAAVIDHPTIFGLQIPISAAIPLWTRTFEFSGMDAFDSLLLDGWGNNTAEVTVYGEEIYGLNETVDINDDFSLILEGTVRPASTVEIHGSAITTNGREINQRGDTASLTPPVNNKGEIDLKSTWTGVVDANLALEIVPTISICYAPWSTCIEVARFTEAIDIGSDTYELTSQLARYDHALPAISARTSTIDFGQVKVGDSLEIDLDVSNLGDIDLEGEALIEGGAFDIIEDDFVATRFDKATVTIVFTPSEDGAFDGRLTLASNDPSKPELSIPVKGSGVAVGGGKGGETATVTGCGCNSTAPASTSMLGLLGLMLIAVRRRLTLN